MLQFPSLMQLNNDVSQIYVKIG